MIDTDVFVVGGGPAGLAASIALRLRGLSVTVADHAVPPIDKACGEGLMPDSVAALSRLGVKADPGDSAPIRGIRFIQGSLSASADFRRGQGMAIRRVRLHQLLVDRASRCGVQLLWGVSDLDFNGPDPAISGMPVKSRFIVGADGIGSRVRHWAKLSPARYESRRFGFRRHFRARSWTDYVEIYWAKSKQLFVAPTRDNELAVTLLTSEPGCSDARGRVLTAIDEFPALQCRIEGTEALTSERGALTIARRLRRVTNGNVALIGDASGSIDSITGEGMCLAFRQAIALADSIAHGNLALYEREHRKICQRARMMSRSMLLLDRFEGLTSAVLAAFSSYPGLFEHVLSFHASG